VLTWMRRGLGDRGGMSAVLGALDSVFNPGAARAHDEIEEQHQRVIPTPSPGDRMLREGRVVIRRSAEAGADEQGADEHRADEQVRAW
jgi:hypothetical protein